MKIKVHVLKRGGRSSLNLRYVDESGKTREKSASTTVRREAERAALRLECQLSAAINRDAILWSTFRKRYLRERLKFRSDGRQRHWTTTANSIDRILSPTLIGDLDAKVISRFAERLKTEGKSDQTIAGYLRDLRAALRWAERMELIDKVPSITFSRIVGEDMAKGRPITLEEFKRMLSKVADVVGEKGHRNWQIYLKGIWLCGLRLSDTLRFTWDDPNMYRIQNLNGRYPMLRVPAKYDKDRKDRLIPLMPDFVEFLRSIPAGERSEFILNPTNRSGRRHTRMDTVSKVYRRSAKKRALLLIATNTAK